MRELRFRYAKYAPNVYRPVVPVRLSAGGRVVEFDALVDSGADQTTFPGSVAKDMGLDMEKGTKRIFSGIGGSVLTYRHRTRVEIAGIGFTLDAHYSNQWNDMPFGLLGQNGFFSRFDEITFDYGNKLLTLKYSNSY